jgi:hypothetical protein
MSPSKPLLSTQQLRAMVEKINATIASHDHKPATARNLKALADAQARLVQYTDALQDSEAVDRTTEQLQAAQAGRAAVAKREEAEARRERQYQKNRNRQAANERKQLAREAKAAAGRRQGSSRRHYPNPDHPIQKSKAQAAAQAGYATARAELAGDRRPEGKQTEPDAELAVTIRELLNRYTSGCVIDMCWATEQELWIARRKEATA